MKINFTKKEYRTLIELLHLGDWVLNAHEVTVKAEKAHYRELIQKVYSHYREMGCENLIEPSNGKFFETRKFEDAMREAIEEYDAETFWEDLISDLARRDAVAQVGKDRFQAMDGYERSELICSKEEFWNDEFSENGLERIRVSA